jgi:hypothetical protein
MIRGIDVSEQNAIVCLYWLQFRCKSTIATVMIPVLPLSAYAVEKLETQRKPIFNQISFLSKVRFKYYVWDYVRVSVGANPTRRFCSSRKQSEQSWR